MKVKIYKVECTESYQIDEQGTGFSLRPWGSDTVYYKGNDDGGKDYNLPEGFEISEMTNDDYGIFQGDWPCPLIKNKYGNPAIIDQSGAEIWLKKA